MSIIAQLFAGIDDIVAIGIYLDIVKRFRAVTAFALFDLCCFVFTLIKGGVVFLLHFSYQVLQVCVFFREHIALNLTC